MWRWPLSAVLAGAAIGLLMRAVETSRIAFGPFALYGNGALIVPAALLPLAIYALWTALGRRQTQPPWAPAILSLVGLNVGLGAYQIAADPGALGPETPALVVLNPFGLLFIVPPAVLAALTVWLFRSGRIPTTPVAVSAAVLLGVLAGAVPPLAFAGGLASAGIVVGAAIVAALRARAIWAPFVVGGALLLLLLVQGFAVPLLILR